MFERFNAVPPAASFACGKQYLAGKGGAGANFVCVEDAAFYFISTWHIRIALSAFLWLSGVTPAQHDESTVIFVSGSAALRTKALLITQMSVQSPTSSISSSHARDAAYSASAFDPNAGLLKIRASSVFSLSEICQPRVPSTQCTTGRFRPSCVSR